MAFVGGNKFITLIFYIPFSFGDLSTQAFCFSLL